MTKKFSRNQGKYLAHYITHCFQFGEEGKMADGNCDFKYEDIPEISPVSKKYMVVKWINIVSCVPDIVMKKFLSE